MMMMLFVLGHYVKERAKVNELEKEAKMWNRKQKIAEVHGSRNITIYVFTLLHLTLRG